MIQVTLDQYSKTLLTVIAILLAIVAVGLFGHTSDPATVEAQVPDSGSQRQLMVEQLREMNVRLGQLTKILSSKTLKVEVTNVNELRNEEG